MEEVDSVLSYAFGLSHLTAITYVAAYAHQLVLHGKAFVSRFSLQIHFLYQYSLQFFMDIFHSVLHENGNLTGITDPTQRLDVITKDLFQVFSLIGWLTHAPPPPSQ